MRSGQDPAIGPGSADASFRPKRLRTISALLTKRAYSAPHAYYSRSLLLYPMSRRKLTASPACEEKGGTRRRFHPPHLSILASATHRYLCFSAVLCALSPRFLEVFIPCCRPPLPPLHVTRHLLIKPRCPTLSIYLSLPRLRTRLTGASIGGPWMDLIDT